jgi:hypothetical protein
MVELGDKEEVLKRLRMVADAGDVMFPMFDGKLENVEGIVMQVLSSGAVGLAVCFLTFVGQIAQDGEFGDEIRVDVTNNGMSFAFKPDNWQLLVDKVLASGLNNGDESARLTWMAERMYDNWQLAKKAKAERAANLH